MTAHSPKYRALVSSDWNECLAPSGPFDVITCHHPDLEPALSDIFRKYTGNIISFRDAASQVQALLPSPVTEDRMDAYLEQSFRTYPGVPELIAWCLSRDILFMINTTGPQGFFQRLFSKELIPRVPALSASPFIRYPHRDTDPDLVYDLFETHDKAANTQAVASAQGIPTDRIIIIGDSGGDGPHFEWGAGVGACLVGSMTKASLEKYCAERGINIHVHFGHSYGPDEPRNIEEEMQFNFKELVPVIEKYAGR